MIPYGTDQGLVHVSSISLCINKIIYELRTILNKIQDIF